MVFFRKELLYVCIIVIGNIEVGWTLTFSSPALPLIKHEFPRLSSFELAAFPAIPSLAAILGTYWGGFLLRRSTRKITLLVNAISSSIFWFMTLTMNEKYFWTTLIIRFFSGIVIGSATTVGGCYTLELAPPDQIGFYGVFNSVMISFGHCTFNLIGAAHSWRVNVYAAAGFSLFQFACGFFLPDSPVDIARRAHKKPKENEEQITKTERKQRSLLQRCYIKPMMIGILLAVFQQLAGVNALVSNMSPLLKKSGLNIDSAYQAAITTSAEVFAGFISTAIMDKVGRRLIWIISGSGACLFMILFSTNLITEWSTILPVIAIFLYMFLFGGGFAPIPWIIVPEMFDDDVRSTANSICVSLNWLFASVVTFCFPYMEKSMHMYGALYFFAACCFCAVIFGYIFIPADPKIFRQSDSSVNQEKELEEEDSKEVSAITEL